MEESHEQQGFKCTGDCINCRKHPNEKREQWQYCAAQFTYNTMRMVGDMQEALRTMQGTVDDLKGKIEAIQNSEANVLFPEEEKTGKPNFLIGTSEMPTDPIAQ